MLNLVLTVEFLIRADGLYIWTPHKFSTRMLLVDKHKLPLNLEVYGSLNISKLNDFQL